MGTDESVAALKSGVRGERRLVGVVGAVSEHAVDTAARMATTRNAVWRNRGRADGADRAFIGGLQDVVTRSHASPQHSSAISRQNPTHAAEPLDTPGALCQTSHVVIGKTLTGAMR